MDILHAQTTTSSRTICNTLPWFFSTETTDELQPVDAGAGRFLKMEVGRRMDMWLEQADNVERWENNSLTASDRRVLITQWVEAAIEELDSREEYVPVFRRVATSI